ncbi:glucosamine-6-phosphate deaminase [Leifsonia sp. 98AMF]|uniref:glucosamine-6-phosphate deaminase n=1 Tax=unclassified Leifsonia TaxID=2663824 RepID=UPI00087A9071|nr:MULTISPECIES: glucosamine-6-phosphate deaminase [unclassified Leifsonia]SDH61621.1 glucosamine-6-phosphate deaminase [Leifsonia sp. 197AMF]SDI77501.1 glucosamine-6-phosphate deaminase [Leifsonia sp. 466MF]SDK09296.1 glucosamine-6-phosphate deaminase [Leifsonia sp. 157MF]SDN80909.1 glucosamine-6-phosphate deaminase [Leifsonia sp. 509MF]SEN26484.1 glucosamine-6-phosphate deaminase [Leifsonia sp. 467MF]
MELIVADDPSAVGRMAADEIAKHMSGRREFRLGVATGSSPLATYVSLAENHRTLFDSVDINAFALDEYIGLPQGSPATYRQTLLQTLARPLGLPDGALHTPDAWAPDPHAAARRYDELVRDAAVDLQLLGIGVNGHIGFNEPFSSLSSRTHVAELTEQTRRDNSRFFPSLSEVPTHCITQGVGTILNAATLLLVAHGAAKADALADAILGPVTWACPASALQLHPDVVIIADIQAAMKLINAGPAATPRQPARA